MTSCSSSDDDDNNTPATTTVIDVALENGLTSLVAALEATGLVATLEGTGPFTLFAADNAAFDVFLTATGIDLDNMSADELIALTNILRNHIIVGENISAADFVTGVAGYKMTDAIGPNGNNLSLYFSAVSDVVLNGQSTVTDADKTATNGILHIVNTVIALPTIGIFMATNPALEDLVTAMELADSGTPTIPYQLTIFNPDAVPFTVFAPTNTAFDSLLAELVDLDIVPDGTEVGDLDPAFVDDFLTYHILATNVTSSQLPDGVVTTLGGEIIADNTAFTLTDGNDRVSTIVTTLMDIQGVNGVVHVIDTVLLPTD